MTCKPLLAFSLSLVAAVAACGGKSRPAPNTGGGGEGDDPATPFDDAAVKAAIRSTPGVAACGADPSTTMGAHFDAQRVVLKAGDDAQPITESFMCRAQADDSWECEWSLFANYANVPAEGKPVPENPCEAEAADAEDPCGGEAGSGYIIVTTVKSDGSLVGGTMNCVAPG
jgi:hypothetical protein